mgnify:FL=1
MSVLRAGNTTLEDGKVRICVPIAYETENEILEESVRIGKSSVADIAEWRIDWYQDVFQPRKRNALAKKIRKNLQGKPLLVTFRSRREGGERDITPTAYQALLDEIIESNSIESNVVDLLDVELSQGMACVQELIKHAHQMGIGVIVSQHDFKKTPEASNLITTMEQMAGYGADVCKIAVMPQSLADVAALLLATGTMKENHPETLLITMSMGRTGCVSRLCGGLFGSVMSFGSMGKASAPGQVSAKELSDVLWAIERAVN